MSDFRFLQFSLCLAFLLAGALGALLFLICTVPFNVVFCLLKGLRRVLYFFFQLRCKLFKESFDSIETFRSLGTLRKLWHKSAGESSMRNFKGEKYPVHFLI